MTDKEHAKARVLITELKGEHTAITNIIESNKEHNRNLAKQARAKTKLWKAIEAEYKINGGE